MRLLIYSPPESALNNVHARWPHVCRLCRSHRCHFNSLLYRLEFSEYDSLACCCVLGCCGDTETIACEEIDDPIDGGENCVNEGCDFLARTAMQYIIFYMSLGAGYAPCIYTRLDLYPVYFDNAVLRFVCALFSLLNYTTLDRHHRYSASLVHHHTPPSLPPP